MRYVTVPVALAVAPCRVAESVTDWPTRMLVEDRVVLVAMAADVTVTLREMEWNRVPLVALTVTT